MALDKFNKKILDHKNDDIFIIFYNEWCGYSRKALELLKNKEHSFKGYIIDNIKGKLPRVLDSLIKGKKLTNFKKDHNTIPIIFRNGKFIGGYSELVEYLNK
jgi:glutaredoxin